jgi:hypothetical protein
MEQNQHIKTKMELESTSIDMPIVSSEVLFDSGSSMSHVPTEDYLRLTQEILTAMGDKCYFKGDGGYGQLTYCKCNPQTYD